MLKPEVVAAGIPRYRAAGALNELDNLYVVDASFFPSSAAVNPTLTIIANALRVGDHLLDRLGSGSIAR